jgi:hypothetical protein
VSSYEFKNCVFVDPGKTTAIVYFTDEIYPHYVEDFRYKKSRISDFYDYLDFMCSEFVTKINEIQTERLGRTLFDRSDKYPIEKVFIEYTEHQQSLKSDTSIRKGSLFKLTLLIGAYCAQCIDMNLDFELLTAREWKKSLTKEATAKRVKRITGLDYNSEHIMDAIAFGLSRDKEVWSLRK